MLVLILLEGGNEGNSVVKYTVGPAAMALTYSSYVQSYPSAGSFEEVAFINFCYGGSCDGPFAETPGYLGVRFDIGANTHYGWIQLVTAVGEGVRSVTIIDWAYNDEPGVPIHVGTTSDEIPTLNEWGLLILAALIMAGGGWSLRRKEEDAGQTPPDATC